MILSTVVGSLFCALSCRVCIEKFSFQMHTPKKCFENSKKMYCFDFAPLPNWWLSSIFYFSLLKQWHWVKRIESVDFFVTYLLTWFLDKEGMWWFSFRKYFCYSRFSLASLLIWRCQVCSISELETRLFREPTIWVNDNDFGH